MIAPKSIQWSNEAASTAGIGYRGHDDAADCSSPSFLPASSSIELEPARRQARRRARAVLSGESAAGGWRSLAYPGPDQGVDTSRHLVSTLEYQFRCPHYLFQVDCLYAGTERYLRLDLPGVKQCTAAIQQRMKIISFHCK